MEKMVEQHEVPREIDEHLPTIGAKLKRLNKLFVIVFVVCIVLLMMVEFIPDSIGSMSIIWVRYSLDAVLSSLLGALVVMLIFDFYDIRGEINYMQESIRTLLSMHQEDDREDHEINMALLKKGDKEEILPSLIKARYSLSDSPEDVARLNSVIQDIDHKLGDSAKHA